MGLENILERAKAGAPFHLLSATEVVVGLGFAVNGIEKIFEGSYGIGTLSLVTSAIAGLGIKPLQKLANYQYTDYTRLKEVFERRGYDERIFRQRRHTRWSREVVRMAAKAAGVQKEVDDYFKEKGYRWYHFLPDIPNAKHY